MLIFQFVGRFTQYAQRSEQSEKARKSHALKDYNSMIQNMLADGLPRLLVPTGNIEETETLDENNCQIVVVRQADSSSDGA